MPITPLFAAIFALGYLYLAIVVIKIRRSEKITYGLENRDSVKNRDLEKAVRIHANFIEYVPLAFGEYYVFAQGGILVRMYFVSRPRCPCDRNE